MFSQRNSFQKGKSIRPKIYVSAYNLFTFTNYSGFDPEASTDVDVKGGVDLATFPEQKIYTIGLDISF